MTQPIFPASMSAIMRWNEGRLKFAARIEHVVGFLAPGIIAVGQVDEELVGRPVIGML